MRDEAWMIFLAARLGGFSIFSFIWIKQGLTPELCRRQYIHVPMQEQKWLHEVQWFPTGVSKS